MARRTNFIDGSDSFREQNLRFVRNEFEDNVNQFFGGANPSGNIQQQQQAPPRDALIVQPTPDGNELDSRRQFLRQLGASPAVAHALAMRTLEVPNFDLRHFQRRRYRLSVELGDRQSQPEIDAVVLQSIGTLVEKSEQNRIQSRPRTPSPPRNINWHNNRDISPQQIERSRPRTRDVDDNIRGRPRGAPGLREILPSGPIEAGPPPGRRNDVPPAGRRDDNFPPGRRDVAPQGRRNDSPPVPHGRRNDCPPSPRINVPQGRRNDVSPGRRDAVPFGPTHNISPARRGGHRDAIPSANVPIVRRNEAQPGRREAVPSGPRNDVQPGPRENVSQGRRDAAPSGPRDNVPAARRNNRSDAVPPAHRDIVPPTRRNASGARENVPSGRRAPPGPGAAIPTVPMDSIPPRGQPIAGAGPRKTVPPVHIDPVPQVGRKQVVPQGPSAVLPPVRGKHGPHGRVEPVAGRGPPSLGKPAGPPVRGKPNPPNRRNNSAGPPGRVEPVTGRLAHVPPGRRQPGPPGRRDNSQGFVERIDLTEMSSHVCSPPHFDGGRNDSYPNNHPDRFPNNRNENFEINNRGMDAEFCGQPDFNDPRFNDANRGPGPDAFLVNQRQNIDRDDDFQRQQHGFDRPQGQPIFMGNPNTEFCDSEPNFGGQQQQSRQMGGRPQIGNNYQRFFHNDQVTILRTDLVDHNERNFDGNFGDRSPDNFGPNDRRFEGNCRNLGDAPRFNDDRDGRQFMDEERIRGQQQADNFGRPQEQRNENWRFYNSEPERSHHFDRSLERNDPNNRDLRFNLNNDPNNRELRFNLNNDDRNAHGRDRIDRIDRNDRFVDDDNCRDQMMFNDSGPGPFQSNQIQFGGDHRFENDGDFDQQRRQFDGDFNQFPQREFDSFRDDFQPNHYQVNVDIDYQDRGDQRRPMDRRNDRSGSGYRNPNAHNQERNTARNTNRSNQPREATRNANFGGSHENRTNSSADRAAKAPRNSNPVARGGKSTAGPNPSQNQKKPNQSTIPVKGGNPVGKNTLAGPNQEATTVRNLANPGGVPKPAAAATPGPRKLPGKPPEANPRAGQKRTAEEALPVGGEVKRRKVIKGKRFLIGGRKLPYVAFDQVLPQEEAESYAVTFFEQTPNYNTNVYANEDGKVVQGHEDDDSSDTDSLELPENTRGGGRQYGKKQKLNRMRKEWTALYRTKSYKDWDCWWTDYKWCGNEINKVLEKFENRNLQHRFIPIYKRYTTEQVVNTVLKLGHVALEKNTFNVQRNMRAIFLLMDSTFLQNLKMENIEQLENLIRRVPNHLWLYKLRSMVYMWSKYHEILKDPPKTLRKAIHNAYARKWKTPMFHWLAKQAFDELHAISEISWPDHNRLYPGIKKPTKK
ncbi:uncharacterized protein Pih1D1 isoform X1 [Drosophila pseudoobscura]|uniref:Uncharacterized protein Pih1D1 isoform X1 n=1 Tax=Drosophila pseudoobscura pseudoobscura TaxID=46245 RepID=A0A6I8UI48_DROPS|nr:uncharacterized protein LOC4816556 isoform X1 [Drosophila pseudoobscura]